jgi:hypothetical protein
LRAMRRCQVIKAYFKRNTYQHLRLRRTQEKSIKY